MCLLMTCGGKRFVFVFVVDDVFALYSGGNRPRVFSCGESCVVSCHSSEVAVVCWFTHLYYLLGSAA
jgi:hypothetical protein